MNSRNNYKRKRSSKNETDKRPIKKRKSNEHPVTKFLGNQNGKLENDTITNDDLNKDRHYSIDLPPEIWNTIIAYLDVDSMDKYSMLSKETLEHAFKLSSTIYMDLFYSSFPLSCTNYWLTSAPCLKIYYLPKIIIGKKNKAYICNGNKPSIFCELCGNQILESCTLSSIVDINFIKGFRKCVKKWLNKFTLYRRSSCKKEILKFTLDYANNHNIINVYKYTGIIKNYRFVYNR